MGRRDPSSRPKRLAGGAGERWRAAVRRSAQGDPQVVGASQAFRVSDAPLRFVRPRGRILRPERAISDEAMERTLDLMQANSRVAGRVLEIGVGTGLLAAPAGRDAGPLVGLDLSAADARQARRKGGGEPAVPVVLARRDPAAVADEAFGPRTCRWVLHLSRTGGPWSPRSSGSCARRRLIVEPRRRRPAPGARCGCTSSSCRAHKARPAGLAGHAIDELDAAMVDLGAAPRPLEAISVRSATRSAGSWRHRRKNRCSWTWKVPDEERSPRWTKSGLGRGALRRSGSAAEPSPNCVACLRPSLSASAGPRGRADRRLGWSWRRSDAIL